MAENNDSDNNSELVLDEVVEVTSDDLSDEQKTFLQENTDDLSDEQKETFKEVLETKEEEDDDDEEIEPETRKPAVKPKEGDDDEEVDSDDEATIGKIVDQRLKAAGVGDTKDQIEVDTFIRDNPDYGKYRANALKYMKVHPSLVAKDALSIVASADQQKIGAKKEREAAKKAADTQGGGSSARKPKGEGRDWAGATKKEMDAKKAEIFDRRV